MRFSLPQIVFIYLLLVAFGLFGWTVRRFVRALAVGQWPRRSFGEWSKRLSDVLLYFFMQRSVAREGLSWHHLPIFWGFLIITVGSLEIIINGVFPAFSFAVFGDWFNTGFKALFDVTNFLVLLVIVYAYGRRIFYKPRLIPMNWDAGLILGMIAGLCISHALAHGMYFVAESAPGSHSFVRLGPGGPISAMPFSGLVYSWFSWLPAETAVKIATTNYWIHVGILLFFLNYIPYSKHMHLLGALPNILLRNRGQSGVMPLLDLEDETQWGVARYEQFDWKALLDSYACTECARCSNACPAMATDKPLSPMHLVLDIKEELTTRGELLTQLSHTGRKALDAGETERVEDERVAEQDQKLLEQIYELPPLTGGRIKEETLWACTTCGACETQCPVFIEHPMKILQMRTNLVLEQEKVPSELARLFRGIENNQNPWGIGSDQRMDWSKGLDIPVMADKGSAEYLVWLGCAGCYDDRGKKIAHDWIGLLQQAGIDFAVLGEEEGCTGDPARRAGNEFLFQMMAESNVDLFRKYGVKKILTSCPHCFHSLKNEYPQFGADLEVWHHSQFLQKLVAEGKLVPDRRIDEQIAFHDPCYMGRWNGVYDEPRAVVGAAGGRAPTELPRNRSKSFCCGAGGARLWVEEDEPRVNVNRSREAVDSGAKVVATACPFCNVMLGDGMKQLDEDENVEVADIAQLLARATGAKPRAADESAGDSD